MSNVTSVVNCTGCKACENFCPCAAISYKSNAEGFLEPFVDSNKCSNCGKCLKSCPQTQAVDFNSIKKILATRTSDKQILMKSTSGGAFSLLANYVLSKNGVVIGCEMSDDFVVHHVAIETRNELDRLHGSKYVQSDIDGTYRIAINALAQGRMVLFSGTPCQIAGLKAQLKHDYDKLILVDILCHGVPSPLLFKKYLEWFEQKKRITIKEYFFRYKHPNAWGLPYRSLITAKEPKRRFITDASFDPYLYAFVNGYSLRKACYTCKYRSENRVGDFSIGDFWNLEGKSNVCNDGRGVSFVALNTDKAVEMWRDLRQECYLYYETDCIDPKECLRFKNDSQREPEIRKEIYNNLSNSKLFESIIRCHPSLKNYFTRYLPTFIVQIIKGKLQ